MKSILQNQWTDNGSFIADYTFRITWPITFSGAQYEAVATGAIYGADSTYDNTNNMIYNTQSSDQCDFRTNYISSPWLRGIAVGH